ncbi:MAG: FAD-dependent oxidoreductase [Bauldia sp.]|nr:FAD-dependent oxidoreductase [Bauldia sp.]
MDVAAPVVRALDRNIDVDVAVIGSGIAGLSVAFELTRRRKSVALLERGQIGRGMTARTTAHLASDWDDGFHRLINERGVAVAEGIHRSQAAAIDRIETIQRDQGIDCDFARVDGYLVLAPDGDEANLERELTAALAVGFKGVRRVARPPVRGSQPALVFPNQARIHPTKYLRGLADAIRRREGKLFARTVATKVEETGDGVTVTSDAGFTVRAAAAVVATNAPITNKLAIHDRQSAARTYAIAAPVPKGGVTDALFWDTADPYHYARLQPAGDHDLLIVGGEDHETGAGAADAELRLHRLEEWARSRFPAMEAIAYRWSGQVLEPDDTIPFIGRNPGAERIFIVTGDSGQGITTGALAGFLIADLITAGASQWADIYDPSRKAPGGLGKLIEQGVSAVKGVVERFTGGDVASVDEIAPGMGAIVKEGAEKIAVYRDKRGQLKRLSASCTHAGCTVHWNRFERCWDCPCHGSHFAPDGSVTAGPAIEPLSPAD